jgi:hypothetical protein
MDPLTPIRSGVLRRPYRFKDVGMGRALADDGTVTHESVRVTWHGP